MASNTLFRDQYQYAGNMLERPSVLMKGEFVRKYVQDQGNSFIEVG